MKSLFPTAALVLGLVLLAGSALWGLIFSPAGNLSEEKAQRLTELTMQAHELLFKVNASADGSPGAAPDAAVKAEYDKVKAELATLRQELTSVQDAPLKASAILRWSGVAFVAAGAFVMFVNRE
jgi:Tfp pilus assembly protein PilN